MASNKRKRLESAIAQVVKQHGSKKEQEKIAKQLLNVVDGNAAGIFDPDPARQIPAIIEYTYEWQLDTTTPQELCEQAGQLRALAETAKAYLDNDHAAALAAGIALGTAWNQFLLDTGPLSVSSDIYSRTVKTLAGTRAKRHPDSSRKAKISAFVRGLIQADVSREDVILRAKNKYRLKESTLEKYYYRPAKLAVDAENPAKPAGKKKAGRVGTLQPAGGKTNRNKLPDIQQRRHYITGSG
jgi:hypothetical protein